MSRGIRTCTSSEWCSFHSRTSSIHRQIERRRKRALSGNHTDTTLIGRASWLLTGEGKAINLLDNAHQLAKARRYLQPGKISEMSVIHRMFYSLSHIDKYLVCKGTHPKRLGGHGSHALDRTRLLWPRWETWIMDQKTADASTIARLLHCLQQAIEL